MPVNEAKKDSLVQTHIEIDRMLELWNERTGGRDTIRPNLPAEVGFTVFSLTNHVVRLTKVILVELEAGFDIEVLPQIRQSIECAMTAAWLDLYADTAGKAFIHEGVRQRKAAFETMVKEGYSPEPGLQQALDLLDTGSNWRSTEGQYFEQRCKSMADGDFVYLMYRLASSLSHAGLGVVDFYLEDLDNESHSLGLELVLDARLDSIDEWLGIQAAMLCRALISFNNVIVTWEAQDALTAIAQSIGVNPVNEKSQDANI